MDMKNTKKLLGFFIAVIALGQSSSVYPVGGGARAVEVAGRAAEGLINNVGRPAARRLERAEKELQEAIDSNASESTIEMLRAQVLRCRNKAEEDDEIGRNLAVNLFSGATDAAIEELKSATRRRENSEKIALEQRGQFKMMKEKYKQFYNFLSDPKKLGQVVAAVGASAILISGAVYGGRFAYLYGEKMLNTPKIVSWTNIPTFWQRYFGSVPKEPSRMKEFVSPPGIDEEIQRLANTIANKVTNGRLLSNVLFYGPPGTGKTLFAKELSKKADAYCDIIPGANFSQFKDGGVQAMNKYFASRLYVAKRDGIPIIVFVDEADAAFPDRRKSTLSSEDINRVNTFLSFVEKPSSSLIMFIFATNHPEALDRAVWSRIAAKIEFKLPGVEQRRQLMVVYLNKHVVEFGITLDDSEGDFETYLLEFAPYLEGFSARGIEQTMVDLQTGVDEAGTNVLTREIARKIIEKKIAEQKLADALEKQKQDQLGLHAFVGEQGGLEQVVAAAAHAA